MVLKCLIYLSNKQIEGFVKAGGQHCNKPPIYDDMALKYLIYLYRLDRLVV